MKHAFKRIQGGGIALLGVCLLAAAAPANDEFNQRMAEQKKEVAGLVSRIEQAIAQDNAVEAEALLTVTRNFIRPEIGVSYEVRFVELRLSLSELRAKLAIRKAEGFTLGKQFEEALIVLAKVQGDLAANFPKTEDTVKALDAAKSKILQSAADEHMNRIETLMTIGKAMEAAALYDTKAPSVSGNSILKYLGERYLALGPLINEAKAKQYKEHQIRMGLEMDNLIFRMTTAIRETHDLEKWEELKSEGNQLWEKSQNTNFDREGARERLQQAVENMENLIGVGIALRQGEVEIASRNAGSLVASLHEGSIVQPGWVEEFVFSHVPEALTLKEFEQALTQKPDFGELSRRWAKSQPIYHNGWPVVNGSYSQVKLDLEFCRDLESMLRNEAVAGFGTLVQRWSGLERGDTVTGEYGRALASQAFLILCRKECGLELQRGDGEDMRSLVKRALQLCAKEGKFAELAVFMPEAVKFVGQDYSSVDPFSEARLVIDYLAATRLEAAGDAMAAARLYRTIVQRGQTLYVPIQKAQERLAALLPGLNMAEEATGLKEELVRINQRLEQLEKEVGELRRR